MMAYDSKDWGWEISFDSPCLEGSGSDGNWTRSIESPFNLTVRTLGFGIPDNIGMRRKIHLIFGICLTIIGFIGAFGNGLVLYVFTKFRRLRGGGGVPLVLSLAGGDLMVSILHFMPAYSSFKEIWSFGELGCDIYAAMVGLGGLASLVTLSVIAVDRCTVIMGQPMKWLAGKRACGGIWFFCLVLVFPPFFGWSRYVPEGLETSCSWDYETRTMSNRLYYIFLLILGFCIPVTAIIISYVGILRIIFQHSKIMKGITRNGIIHDAKRPTKNDRRTAQVILTIVICFLVSWTPYAVVSLIGQFGPVGFLSPMTSAMPAIFAKASVIYNPIIYGLTHPHFRSAVKTLRSGTRFSGTQYPNSQFRALGGKKNFVDSRRATNHQDLTRQTSANTGGGQGQVGGRLNSRNSMRGSQTSRSSDTEVIIHKRGQWVVLRKNRTKAMEATREIVSSHELPNPTVPPESDPSVDKDSERESSESGVIKRSESGVQKRSESGVKKKRNFLKKYFSGSDNCLERVTGSGNKWSMMVSMTRARSIKSQILLKNNNELHYHCDRSRSCSNLEKLRRTVLDKDDDEVFANLV